MSYCASLLKKKKEGDLWRIDRLEGLWFDTVCWFMSGFWHIYTARMHAHLRMPLTRTRSDRTAHFHLVNAAWMYSAMLFVQFENIENDAIRERERERVGWSASEKHRQRALDSNVGRETESSVWPRAFAPHWAGCVENKGRVAVISRGAMNALFNTFLRAVGALTYGLCRRNITNHLAYLQRSS